MVTGYILLQKLYAAPGIIQKAKSVFSYEQKLAYPPPSDMIPVKYVEKE